MEFEESFKELIRNSVSIADCDREEIAAWCKDNNINAIFVGMNFHNHIWFIKENDDRVLFMLRWSK